MRTRRRAASAVGRFGFWIAAATAFMTVLTFALALTALPDLVFPTDASTALALFADGEGAHLVALEPSGRRTKARLQEK